MICKSQRLLQPPHAVPADCQETISNAEALCLTNAIQPLAECNRHSSFMLSPSALTVPQLSGALPYS
jgi:hypothetical protein